MSRKTLFLSCAVCCILIIISVIEGCNSGASVTPASNISYNRDIQPILSNNCSFPGCHNNIEHASELDLTSWEGLMIRGSKLGNEIIPYNSFWSHMLHHINRDTNVSLSDEPFMPRAKRPYSDGAPLTQAELNTIITWIKEGARNDNGEVAYSNVRNKAFVTNQSADLVAVINLDNDFVIRLIPVGGNTAQGLNSPHFIKADEQGKYFYISLIKENYLEKYDAVTYEKVGRLAAGTSPAHIVLTHDGTRGYFSNFDPSISNPERNVKVFNTGSMTVTDTISEFRMNQPHGLRLTHDESKLLITTEASEYMYVVTTSDKVIQAIVPLDPSVPPNGNGTRLFVPYQIALSNDDKYAFVSCLKSNDVRVFDIDAMTFVQNIPVGTNPLALDISPDGRWCYVPNRNDNSVSVIDVQTKTVIKTIPNVGAQPHLVAFSPDGHYALVSCESTNGAFIHHPTVGSKKPGTTAVIDVWNDHTKVKDVEMASFPAGITVVH